MGGYMDQILSQVGEDVTLTKVTSNTTNKWGDETSETKETKTVHGKFEVERNETSHEEEGDFEEGDLKGFLHERWEDDLDEGHRITYNGKDYQITRVEKQRLEHGLKHVEIRAKPYG